MVIKLVFFFDDIISLKTKWFFSVLIAKQVTFQEMTVPNHYLWMYEDKKILYMVKWVDFIDFRVRTTNRTSIMNHDLKIIDS